MGTGSREWLQNRPVTKVNLETIKLLISFFIVLPLCLCCCLFSIVSVWLDLCVSSGLPCSLKNYRLSLSIHIPNREEKNGRPSRE